MICKGCGKSDALIGFEYCPGCNNILVQKLGEHSHRCVANGLLILNPDGRYSATDAGKKYFNVV